MPRQATILIFLGGALLLPSTLAAAAPVSTTAKEGRIDVTVRGQAPSETNFDDTRASARREADEIRATAATSVPDALRGLTGTAVQQTTPGQGTVYLRGMASRQVVHSVDGVRLNSAIYRAGNNPYLGLVDPYALAMVRVLRGSSSVRYGSGALGGVIDMHTPLPGYALVANGHTGFFALQRLSSNGPAAVSRLGAEYQNRRWAGHVGFTTIRAGDVRPGRAKLTPDPASYWGSQRLGAGTYWPRMVRPQKRTAFSFYAGDLALRHRIVDGQELILRAQLGLRPELVRYDQLTPRFKRAVPSRAESSLAPYYRSMVSATWIQRSRRGWLARTLIRLSWQRLSEDVLRHDYDQPCMVGNAAADIALDHCSDLRLFPATTVEHEQNRSDRFDLQTEFRTRTSDHGLSLIAGSNFSFDWITSRAWQHKLDTGQSFEQPERYPHGSSQSQLGLFVQGQLEPAPSWRFYAGLRGSLFVLAIEPRRIAPAGQNLQMHLALPDAALTVGVRWEPLAGLALVSNVARGVRAPNVQDFATLGPRAGGRYQIPNDSVQAEHSLSFDWGIKLHRAEVEAESFVFFLRHHGAIGLAPTTSNGQSHTPMSERYYTSVNASSVEVYGVEGSLRIPVSSQMGLWGNYLAVMGTQYNLEGLDLPLTTPADRVPPPSGTLGFWVEPRPNLHLAAFVRGYLAQDRLNDPINLADNRIPEGGTPGYLTLHTRLGWQANRALMVRLALDNLTNELVLEHGSGFYAPGFNATAGLDVQL